MTLTRTGPYPQCVAIYVYVANELRQRCNSDWCDTDPLYRQSNCRETHITTQTRQHCRTQRAPCPQSDSAAVARVVQLRCVRDGHDLYCNGGQTSSKSTTLHRTWLQPNIDNRTVRIYLTPHYLKVAAAQKLGCQLCRLLSLRCGSTLC
jgi:hypothetical protein